ncbi:carboxylesterase/lipase family protein [Pseudomonas aeruginosa]|nr:carboxylesterase/lipase family protein [Pseudomonas aeruginosa]
MASGPGRCVGRTDTNPQQPGSTIATAPIVQTSAGKVRGVDAGRTLAYKAIPYGAPTGGEHRFHSPKPASPWQGVRDCMDYGATAPQGAFRFGSVDSTHSAPANSVRASLAQALMGMKGEPQPSSEDCLFLNVFTPAIDAAKRPVMVWLHGGGFSMGSASTELYDGGALAHHGDVVVITLNHRLHAPGFLYLGDVSQDYASSANAGMQDIVLALQWIRDNITAFGGDPKNVTLFGQSGGGQKVGVLMAMPSAAGLFHKAIMQSGPADRVVPQADAALLTRRFMEKLGLSPADLHKLHDADISELLQAAGAVQFPVFNLSSALAPVVDGNVLPAQPFAQAAPEISRDIPLMVGTTKDEFIPFLAGIPNLLQLSHQQAREHAAQMIPNGGANLYDMYLQATPGEAPLYLLNDLLTDLRFWSGSVHIAELKAAQRAAPVYMYRLIWEAPGFGGFLRSPHGLDISLVFGNLDIARTLIGEGQVPEKISNEMMSAWTSFARHGDPSLPQLAWPVYHAGHRATMEFSAETKVTDDPLSERRLFWRQHA